MIKKIITFLVFSLIVFSPALVLAVDFSRVPTQQIISIPILLNKLLSIIWPIFIGFAVIMFIVAGFFFIKSQGNPEEVKTARNFVIWGIVGVVVGVLAFTIPYLIQDTLMAADGGNGGQCLPAGSACLNVPSPCCSGTCRQGGTNPSNNMLYLCR